MSKKHDLEIDYSNFEKHTMLPIYRKSLDIRKLTNDVVEYIDEEKDDLNIKQQMLENAYMISAKIAGAEAGELYSYRLENALSIKRFANELNTELALCESKGIGKPEAMKMLKVELEEFRKMFISWVESFDRSKDVEDPWSLWQDEGGG